MYDTLKLNNKFLVRWGKPFKDIPTISTHFVSTLEYNPLNEQWDSIYLKLYDPEGISVSKILIEGSQKLNGSYFDLDIHILRDDGSVDETKKLRCKLTHMKLSDSLYHDNDQPNIIKVNLEIAA